MFAVSTQFVISNHIPCQCRFLFLLIEGTPSLGKPEDMTVCYRNTISGKTIFVAQIRDQLFASINIKRVELCTTTQGLIGIRHTRQSPTPRHLRKTTRTRTALARIHIHPHPLAAPTTHRETTSTTVIIFNNTTTPVLLVQHRLTTDTTRDETLQQQTNNRHLLRQQQQQRQQPEIPINLQLVVGGDEGMKSKANGVLNGSVREW